MLFAIVFTYKPSSNSFVFNRPRLYYIPKNMTVRGGLNEFNFRVACILTPLAKFSCFLSTRVCFSLIRLQLECKKFRISPRLDSAYSIPFSAHRISSEVIYSRLSLADRCIRKYVYISVIRTSFRTWSELAELEGIDASLRSLLRSIFQRGVIERWKLCRAKFRAENCIVAVCTRSFVDNLAPADRSARQRQPKST